MKTWSRYATAFKHRGESKITFVFNYRLGKHRRECFGLVPTNEEIKNGHLDARFISTPNGGMVHIILMLDGDGEYCIRYQRFLLSPLLSTQEPKIITTGWTVIGKDRERAERLFNSIHRKIKTA